MSKSKDCYYVLNIGYSKKVVTDIQNANSFLGGFDVTKEEIGLVITSFAQCESLKEAKKVRKQNGGIILKGIMEIL